LEYVVMDNSPDGRRREVRAIRDAVAKGDLAEIAAQLRAMTRLWGLSRTLLPLRGVDTNCSAFP
jgi:hypothetical protein